MWYIYTMDYLALKKEENLVICHYMDEPREYLAKWNNPDREKQVPMVSDICESENNDK